jgi:hypothetical protein
MKIALNIFKFLLGGAGVLIFFHYTDLYSQFARSGASQIDAIHRVYINNHGSISYITVEQDAYLTKLLVIAIAMVGAMFGVDLFQRKVLQKH